MKSWYLTALLVIAFPASLVRAEEREDLRKSLLDPLLTREVEAGGNWDQSLVLDDKCPVACKPPKGRLYGGVEATFFKFSRGDGVRVAGSEFDQGTSANADYEAVPRYTLGYLTGKGSGFRARYWGDYQSTSLPYSPERLANGDRLTAEAMALDLEFFETISSCGFDIELSAGLQYADFYEEMFGSFFFNQGGTNFATKGLNGWGPVFGMEFRRPLGSNSLMFARARHSILHADSSIAGNNPNIGESYLTNSNAGISELAFGLEHQRCIGNAQVTLQGGYEWQLWRNFSYAFEDTDESLVPSGPADAGFHGFTFGVEVTSKGVGGLPEGKGHSFPASFGDFAHAGKKQPSGLFGEFEATFLKYNDAGGGLLFDTNLDDIVDMDYEFAPRYTLGYQFDCGPGVRARFWGDYSQQGVPENPADVAEGDRVQVSASTLDIEFYDQFSLGKYNLGLSAGFQNAHFYLQKAHEGDQGNPPGRSVVKSATGWGGVIGAELERPLNHRNRFYAKGRHSLLLLDAATLEGRSRSHLNGSNGGITEIAFGLEHERCIGNASVTLRGGYEWQRWHNYSFGFEDPIITTSPSGPADAGFHGFHVGVGITGRSPGEDDCLPGDKGGIDYPESDSGLFGGYEATYFKWGRADGMRFDINPEDLADPDYEYASRYTLGFRSHGGPGFRARYWGDFESTALPYSPDDRAEGSLLYAEASSLDLEFFDTFSLCHFDLELSAGVQYADYFEEQFDFPNNQRRGKSVTGWGPVIGAELSRCLFDNTLVYAKARHSIHNSDATVSEVSGGSTFGAGYRVIWLDGVNAGITELGFGVEHNLCVGGSNVHLKGGYEWQRWHSVSYGLDASFSDADASSPADAAFQGFTIGVGITR